MPETPTVTTEPVGLTAASAERQGAAERSEREDAASGAEGIPLEDTGPANDGTEWRVAVELALDTLDQVVSKWCPTWEPTRGPLRDAGVLAWSRYLQTIAEAPGPLAQALAFTAGRYGPPLWIGWQLRRSGELPEGDDADDPRG